MNPDFAREAEEAAKKINWLQKFRLKAFGSKLVIDHEFSADGIGKYPIYLFWCNECRRYAKNRRSGKRRLYCSSCKTIYYLPWSQYKESGAAYYEIENVLENKRSSE